MDDADIDSLGSSGASNSDSGFWNGLGQSLGTAAGVIVSNKLNPPAQKTTPGTPTTQTAASPLSSINPTYLIAGGVLVLGLFAVIALKGARR
jgi:hypothetical protein